MNHQTNINTPTHNYNNVNHENSDSFASSVLLQQSSNYDENNLTSEFADYEQEDEEDENKYVEYETNERRAPMMTNQTNGNEEDIDEAEDMPVRHSGK